MPTVKTHPARLLELACTGVLCALLLVPFAHGQTITINEARNQGGGTEVTVDGTVTRAFGDFVRFQDESGSTGASGLVVRQTSGAFHDDIQDGTITQGTELQVSGTLSEFNGLLQINEGDLDDYTVQDQGTVPSPQDVELVTLRTNGEDYESELVQATGLDFVRATGTFLEDTSYPVIDTVDAPTLVESSLTFRVQGSGESNVIGDPIPNGVFEYTGIVGEFNSQYQLIPVQSSDVQPIRSFEVGRPFAQAEEGSGTVEVDVKAFATESGDDVSVTATVGTGSTADAGDVGGFSGSETFTFSGDDPPPQTLSLDPIDDGTDEGVERLEVVLESSDGAIARPQRFTLWLLDAPAVQTTIAAGDSGDALVDALQQQFGDPRPLGYDLARDSMYARIYNDETNTIEGTYSGFQITVDPSEGDPSAIAADKGINTEHTWPQSKGAGQEPARSDLHILVPTRQQVNSARSNLPFGESPDTDTDTWYFEDQTQSSPPEADRPLWSELLSGQKFEPRHSVKGNVARAAFYFVTIYPNRANFSFFDAQRDTLLAWHERDPVDATEMRRNLTQAGYQDNALNPFVLDATLAERAYGSGADAGDDPPAPGTFELFANESDLTPSSGQTGVQCLVQRSTGELVFFNSNDGGIFSWNGSSLSEERASDDLNNDISGESNTIDRCDGIAVDASDNAYFLLRASGSSSTNSWPTFVYKLPASGSPTVLANEDGLQGVAHDSGALYLAGVSFRGAPIDGFFSIDDSGAGQSLTEIVSNSNLDLDYGMDVDGSGDVYAFSGEFAEGNRVRKIVRVVDPAGSATLEEFVDPYGGGSPLIPDSGSDIEDLDIVTYEGTEYVVVYNGSFQAQDGDQWGTIQLSDQSIEVLFNRTDLLNNIPKSGYTSAFTRPMTVNSSGDVFTTSRFREDNGEVQSTDYIAKVSDAPPLPVEMAGFDAAKNGSSVELTWQTASETNNARFEIQRSIVEPSRRDGSDRNWTTLGAVEGVGTTETPQAYRFTDSNPPFAVNALTYRLKQVDLDGSVSYSEPVTVQQTVEEVLLRAPFPNPARGQATVRFAVPERQDVTLRLYDVLGRRVATVAAGSREGRQEKQLDVSGLSSGVYFLRLKTQSETRLERLVVGR